jgi:cis-3-alkyl-4-acyloxetan-2-one decarboxylase
VVSFTRQPTDGLNNRSVSRRRPPEIIHRRQPGNGPLGRMAWYGWRVSAREPAPDMPRWLERQLPFERYRIDVGGQHMHVMERGEGTPVVLVHGNPTWGYLYRKVAASLSAARLRLIIPDLIGLGFSDKPRAEAHSLAAHQAWMSRLLERLGLDRCVMVVQDWGGAIGVGGLCDQPALPAGLVVLNTALSPPRRNYRPSAFHRFAQLPVVSELTFRGLGFPQRFLWATPCIGLTETRAYAHPLRHLGDNAAPLALARMVPSSFDHPSIPPLERVKEYVTRFKGPAEIVWGDRDPILGRVRTWIEKLLPDAPVTRTHAGHFLQEEVPAPIAAAIERVAQRLEEER